MRLNFAIGIPTINRYDLLKEALDQYKIDFPNTLIYIVDNGKQNIESTSKNIIVLYEGENLGVAGSWNLLCKEIYKKHKYAFILNDDIILGKTEKEISNLLKENSKEDFFVNEFTWCSFILPKETFKKVGEFDTKFYPAYFEDNDYFRRMKLLNLSYYTTSILYPSVYRNSMTKEKNVNVNAKFDTNDLRYIDKWGNKVGKEEFVIPFNGQYKQYLNIITPVSRTENLFKIHRNLSLNASDNLIIIWWVIFDKCLEDVFDQFVERFKVKKSSQVMTNLLLSSHEKAIAGHAHRNIILNILEKNKNKEDEHDWIYNLDDDNLLHPELISLLKDKQLKNTDIVLFSQNYYNNVMRLKADINTVKVGFVDSAMLAFKTSSLQGIRFIEDDYCADGHFIKDLWDKNSKRQLYEESYCYYNALGEKVPKIHKPTIILEENEKKYLQRFKEFLNRICSFK